MFEASQESNWSKHIHQTEIPTHLQLISDLLVRETTSLTSSNTDLDPPSSSSSTSATELFIQKDILTDLVKISENDVPVGFRAEVMHFSSSLVQFLDNRILSQVAITRPLLQLITMHASGSDTYDEDVLELEYNIAAKIREQPLLLDMYFFKKEPAVPVHDIQDSSSSSNSTTSDVLVSPELVEGGSLTEAGVGDSGSAAGAGGVDVPNSSSTSEYEFLIYDHLLRNIHQDGGVGDIARTGIMFLFELAADERLAAYIAASDFSNLAIAGLGGESHKFSIIIFPAVSSNPLH